MLYVCTYVTVVMYVFVGDNARGAIGIFYEGCMTKGLSSDAADDLVQANIVAAGYRSLQ
jgi:hypothetical protein